MKLAGLNKKRKPRGVTLFETLVTVGVMAVLLPVIMDSLSQSMRGAGVTRDKSKAITLCESKMAEILATSPNVAGLGTGNFGDDAPGYEWNAAVFETSETGMQELRVVVSWKDINIVHDVTMSSLVYTGTATSGSVTAGGGL